MIQLVCAEGEKWRKVMILLVCADGEQTEQCDDTACVC